MDTTLKKITFTAEDLPDVQDFDCGSEEWCVEVSGWIKGGPDGVLEDMQRYGTEVWLYVTEQDGLIGFGSLGAMDWSYPSKSSKKQPISIVPNLAIQTRFQGHPRGTSEDRYSVQIINHLRAEALKHPDRSPALGLFTHPHNLKAISFYEKRGFIKWSAAYTNSHNGLRYQGMLLRL